MISLYDADNLTSLPWPAYAESEKRWLSPFVQRGAKTFIDNVDAAFYILLADEDCSASSHVFPVTVNHTEYENSYVCSPYTHNISYALEELHHLHCKPLQGLFALLLKALGVGLKAGRVNQVVHVNNWLLSTNLYPPWQGEAIPAIKHFCLSRWPDHALVFRSINPWYEQAAYERFQQAGFQFFLTRKVYMFDGRQPEYLKKINVKRDLACLRKSHYQWVRQHEITEADIPRIVALYQDLYLKKYSYHNPQFTEAYIRLCLTDKLLTLHGLRHPNGQLDGVIGYFNRNGVMTAPLVGYDRSLPQQTGLYRMLMAMILQSAAEEGILLNLSAGAADFKRLRGGIGQLEYSAIYSRHLPCYRQLPWHVLMGIMNTVGKTIIEQYQL